MTTSTGRPYKRLFYSKSFCSTRALVPKTNAKNHYHYHNADVTNSEILNNKEGINLYQLVPVPGVFVYIQCPGVK